MAFIRFLKGKYLMALVFFILSMFHGYPLWAQMRFEVLDTVIENGQEINIATSVPALMASSVSPHFFEIQPKMSSGQKIQSPIKQIRFVCLDSNDDLILFCNMEFTISKSTNSGGHSHDDDQRPCGILTDSDGNTNGITGTETEDSPCSSLELLEGNSGSDGVYSFTYKPSQVSGFIGFRGSAYTDTGIFVGSFSTTIGVMVTGLVALPSGAASYNLVGSTSEHPNNHYGAPAFNKKVIGLANDFALGFPGEKMDYNDISLPQGGLFDVVKIDTDGDGIPDTLVPWKSPHESHRFGEDMDIRSRTLSRENRAYLTFLLSRRLIDRIVEGNHWHLRNP